MDIDQSEEESARKSDELRKLSTSGGLSTSIAKLSGSLRVVPTEKDFHFYNNFKEFKNPVQEIDGKAKNLLQNIGSLEDLFGKPIPLPDDKEVALDEDAGLDWVENVNDELFERFDVSVDEFKSLRKKEEETGVRTMRVNPDDENGFQTVYGKKNKKSLGKNLEVEAKGASQEVKVAAKMKAKVPFHIPTIPKPQDEYKIIVNNSNQPFEHVWLERSEDGSRFVHPLENLSVLDFVDEIIGEPVKPPPIEDTPFKIVEEVKDLKQVAMKLRHVDEFAVDLEHNQYRSFQGLTCLMQISTRTEDFVIDTLKLRVHVGPHLREVFKDPTKRKVMHGADRDIVWLQRDFGIYVCNMFDTGQASRVLKMERHSLEYLLNHFCGVVANKEYQNADWRIRPLPPEMLKYAREDTHYLLYIYDLMRAKLLELPIDSESSEPLLFEVYSRSYDVCTQLYEKELLTQTSYLHIYGLQDAYLSAQQLAVVCGLCEWRDAVARTEDESTGYILPNRTLIEIAKQMPLTANQLRRALKSKLPYVERNLGSVISIIRHAIQNAAAFEEAAKQLKEKRSEMANAENVMATEEPDLMNSEAPEILKNAEDVNDSHNSTLLENSSTLKQDEGKTQDIRNCNAEVAPSAMAATSVSPGEPQNTQFKLNSSNSVGATVQILKKPSRAFGALLGNSAKRKHDSDKTEQGHAKLEQIKSTVSLPFHSFSGTSTQSNSKVEESAMRMETLHQENVSAPAPGSTLEDVIVLDDDSDIEDLSAKDYSNAAASDDQLKQPENVEDGSASNSEDEPMSLSELSSSFDKCFPPLDRTTLDSKSVDKSQPLSLQVEPFDYDTARKQVKFGEDCDGTEPMDEDGENRRRSSKKGSAAAKSKNDGGTTNLPQGRRRQAFPASGNRSATFR
ncbi:protein RRP6-like 2 isoform X2 [Andrographis paniculata]|uniref:protein RRP6-like 2 isoform X2 n=1 Tax=Andrographis paniculata TaxID=175694 RepID=UPI0021E74FD2|nr:protein RRP6-like 2 isoform X2 [Andrographis paniculata]